MSKRWATASALERVIECPASAALPHLHETSSFAKSGHVVHSQLEAASEPGAEVVSVGGFIIRVEDLRLPAGSLSEHAYSWDVVTGEAKSHGKLPSARDYPESDYSTLFGTADISAIVEIDLNENKVPVAFVSDYKSGRASFLPDSDSWQMRFLAMAIAKAKGVSYAVTRITGVRDGFVFHKPQKLWTPEELAETEVILRRTYDAVNARGRKGVAISDVHVGSHCHWCPAWRSCPANIELIKNVPGARGTDPVDERETTAAWALWQQLKTASSHYESMFKRISAAAPVHIGNGKVFGVASDGKFRAHKP